MSNSHYASAISQYTAALAIGESGAHATSNFCSWGPRYYPTQKKYIVLCTRRSELSCQRLNRPPDVVPGVMFHICRCCQH